MANCSNPHLSTPTTARVTTPASETTSPPNHNIAPAACPDSFALSVRSAVLHQFDLVQSQYELLENQRRALVDDGKRHHRYSCRTNALMSIPVCLRFILCMQATDIHAELVASRLFQPWAIPSESSYCQCRDKIPLELFEGVFKWFVEQHYWKNPRCIDPLTYHILAVDGTENPYPANPREPDNYVATRSESKARNLIHINSCFDVTHSFTVDLIPQNAHDKNERSALYQFIGRIAARFPDPDQRSHYIMTSDRGYEAWNLPVLADHCGISFLCRIKSEDSNGILSGLTDRLPVSRNSFDRFLTLTLTRDASKEGHSSYYVLSQNTFCELVTPGHDYTLTIRFTKIRISDSVTELTMSNLPAHLFTKEDIKLTYNRRWPVETSFSFVKYPCCLNAPHASSMVPVLKETYFRFLLLNITSAIVYHDGVVTEYKENTGRKYDYTRDFSSAVADVRAFMLSDEVYDLDQIVRQLTRPIRNTPPTERHKSPRKPPKHGHRQG